MNKIDKKLQQEQKMQVILDKYRKKYKKVLHKSFQDLVVYGKSKIKL